MQGRAPGAKPEGLDERGDLTIVVAVHVTDPEDLRDIGLEFLLQEEPGRGGAAIEQQGGFVGLDQDA